MCFVYDDHTVLMHTSLTHAQIQLTVHNMLKKTIITLSCNLCSQNNRFFFWGGVVQSLQQISTVTPLYKTTEVYKNRHRTYIKSLHSRVLEKSWTADLYKSECICTIYGYMIKNRSTVLLNWLRYISLKCDNCKQQRGNEELGITRLCTSGLHNKEETFVMHD